MGEGAGLSVSKTGRVERITEALRPFVEQGAKWFQVHRVLEEFGVPEGERRAIYVALYDKESGK